MLSFENISTVIEDLYENYCDCKYYETEFTNDCYFFRLWTGIASLYNNSDYYLENPDFDDTIIELAEKSHVFPIVVKFFLHYDELSSFYKLLEKMYDSDFWFTELYR